MNTPADVRWKQRFQNFDRAFVLLRSALENSAIGLNQLEQDLRKIVLARRIDDTVPRYGEEITTTPERFCVSPIEKEGVIQRFEYSFELAWKTIKDYLEDSGLVFAIVAPGCDSN
jgi:Nucleotidyltransferase substrate binding protein like